MKSSLEHLPERKQREIARIVEIVHEEFEDALKEARSETKRRGRIFKIILFGSYAKGTWVDEPHTMKGYRFDYDILIIVNERRFAEYEYWDRATDHLNRDPLIGVPVGVIVHSARDVNNFLRDGNHFFSDIRRDGIVLYELDDRELALPGVLTPVHASRVANKHFRKLFPSATGLLDTTRYSLGQGRLDEAAFLLHQSVERAYTATLLVLTNYAPKSHNLKHLRMLSEDRDRRFVETWPRDQQRYTAWFNILNAAYLKARYSDQFEISEEALRWLIERAEHLIDLVRTVCAAHLDSLAQAEEDHE